MTNADPNRGRKLTLADAEVRVAAFVDGVQAKNFDDAKQAMVGLGASDRAIEKAMAELAADAARAKADILAKFRAEFAELAASAGTAAASPETHEHLGEHP